MADFLTFGYCVLMGVVGLLASFALAYCRLAKIKYRRTGIITNCVPAKTSHDTLPVVGGESSQMNQANNPKQIHNQKCSNQMYQRGCDSWWLDFKILFFDGVSWGLVLLLCFLLFKSRSANTFSHLSLLITIVTTISVAELGTISMKLFIHVKYAESDSDLTGKKRGGYDEC